MCLKQLLGVWDSLSATTFDNRVGKAVLSKSSSVWLVRPLGPGCQSLSTSPLPHLLSGCSCAGACLILLGILESVILGLAVAWPWLLSLKCDLQVSMALCSITPAMPSALTSKSCSRPSGRQGLRCSSQRRRRAPCLSLRAPASCRINTPCEPAGNVCRPRGGHGSCQAL